MIENNFFIPVSGTFLGRALSEQAEQMSEEEKTRLEEAWVTLQLDRLFHIAIFSKNKNVARAICETAADVARGDNELLTLIKDRLKNPAANRPKKWSHGHKIYLLIQYANAVRFNKGDKKKAIEELCDSWFSVKGELIGFESMNNLVSKFIKEVLIEELPGPLQPIIQGRIVRGKKSKKATERTT